jgi:hypothetical protein
MKNLDDGPDGLNDEAFDRALGAPRARKAKRPSVRIGDTVSLSPIKSMIPAYDGKPAVLRDTVLTVSSITGTGAKRNPYHVVVTDGTRFWHLEPGDVTPR